MNSYERNIKSRLFSLRGLFFILVILILILFIKGLKDYAFVTLTIFLFCTVLRVATIAVDDDKLQITRYYFFGIMPRRICLRKEEMVSITTFEIVPDDPGIVGLPWWFDLVASKQVTIKKYIIESVDFSGITNTAKIDLSWQELQLVMQKFFDSNSTKV